MDYSAFCDLWHETLAETGLITGPVRPTETIDLQQMDRCYKVYLRLDHADQPRPFYVQKARWPDLPQDAFALSGYRCNRCYVIPSLDLVVARVGSGPAAWDDNALIGGIVEAL